MPSIGNTSLDVWAQQDLNLRLQHYECCTLNLLSYEPLSSIHMFSWPGGLEDVLQMCPSENFFTGGVATTATICIGVIARFELAL